MSEEEKKEMKEEEKKESLFACVQRWLEGLQDLADFPGKYERAIKNMLEKKLDDIKKNGDKKDYENKIKRLEEVATVAIFTTLTCL